MPCPTGSFKIISRGKGQSCMASCAYYAGEKKYSEYECCWKYPHSSPARVKWVEVMLPSNAPRAYADPQTLWNAVDAAETSVNAQTARSMLFALPRELTDEQNLALVRDFCQKESAAKERRIRDIDALFGAIQTIRELKPIQQEYEGIHWNSKREKFKAEHGGELSRLQKALWLREKLVKSLGLASHLDKEQRMALKAERTRLEAEREALLPKLEEIKAELAELNRIRYWTRKVIPDALPRVSDGRVSVEDAMETAGNRKELEQVEIEAVQTALRELEESKSLQSERKQTDNSIYLFTPTRPRPSAQR